METAIAVALIGSGATLLTAATSAVVAVTIYRRGERGRARDAAREQQRLNVVRMLDTMDSAVRSRLSLPLVRGLRDLNTDVLLALPRLLIELPKVDLPVATWCAGQVQQGIQIVHRKPFIDCMLNIEARLISWHRGDITIEWFEDALKTEPYDPDFQVPKKMRIRSWLQDTLELSALLGVSALVRRAWRYASS